jgi:hypothetical protein
MDDVKFNTGLLGVIELIYNLFSLSFSRSSVLIFSIISSLSNTNIFPLLSVAAIEKFPLAILLSFSPRKQTSVIHRELKSNATNLIFPTVLQLFIGELRYVGENANSG